MVRRNMIPHFRWVRTYLGTVPTYPGALWTFTMGTQARDPAMVDDTEIASRLEGIATQCYTALAHRGLFDLPPFLRTVLSTG
jgi:spermidine synthase